MFYIIDRFTGEVLFEAVNAADVAGILRTQLPTGYGWADVLVQVDAESGFNLPGDVWMEGE